MEPIDYLAALPVVLVAGPLVYAAANDARRYLIPNWISVGIVLLFLPYSLLSPTTPDWQGGLIAAFAALAAGLVLFRFRLMGGGDVKLIAACALWAGTNLIAPFLTIVSLAGGALALGLLIGRSMALRNRRTRDRIDRPSTPLMRQKIPYGLAISAGGIFLVARHLGALGFTL